MTASMKIEHDGPDKYYHIFTGLMMKQPVLYSCCGYSFETSKGCLLGVKLHPITWFSKSIEFPKKEGKSRVKPFILDVLGWIIKLMSAFYCLKLLSGLLAKGGMIFVCAT